MTTEDDFQKALAKNPRDWQTLLVFADWLQERGDPRADGYRALGVRRAAPSYFDTACYWVWLNRHWANTYDDNDEMRAATLPDDWYDLLPRVKNIPNCAAERRKLHTALNDAARAFPKLSAARRAELMVPPPDPPRKKQRPKKRKPAKRTRKK